VFPEETTRFHPTYFYEIILNAIIAGVLLWVVRKWPNKFKAGSAFYLYLIFEGIKRFFIEFFRPDQPRIGATNFSYSRLVALLMAVLGGFLLAVRSNKIKVKFLSLGDENYANLGD
jgi:phosphatidylglycerol:prolipoprotein diacylglycerol transferase